MVDYLPDPPAFAIGRWRRDWQDYAQYRVIHENHLDALEREGLLVAENTRFQEIIFEGRILEVNLTGRIHTANGATLTVNKWLALQERFGRLAVMTSEYDYHARADGHGLAQDLFRYDNCDGDTETLHRHTFDAGGIEVRPKRPVDLATLPPLNIIVREADFYAAWLLSRRAQSG